MEPWSYVAEGKGFSCSENVSTPDLTARSKNALVDWDSRTTCTFGNNMSVSGHQSAENESFKEFSFPTMTGKQISINSIGDGLCSKVGEGRNVNHMMSFSSAFAGEVESSSRMSSSVVESSSRDASLIDLKLGRFPDHRDVHSSRFFKGTAIMSSSESSTPPKRARAGGANSQTAYCQVYGCNKDLSSSKDYHKRHKVCEVHSKTAKVIVNGIEQRFCQQCSRFHLLSEFDDGKRSCRKRLAGHNERRRKPQVGMHSGRPGRLLQSYNGGRFQGTAFSTASFICQDLLPTGLFHSDKYGLNDLCRPVKVENGTDYSTLPAIPISNGHLNSKSVFPYGNERQFSHFNVNGARTSTGSVFSDSSSQFPNDLRNANSGSPSLFQDTSLGSNDYNIFDAASTIQGLSGMSDSCCALSLLSSHSQTSSTHSSGIPMSPSLVMLGDTHSSMSGVSEKLMGVSSQTTFNGLSNKLSPSLSSKQGSHLGPILISDSDNAANFGIADGIDQGSEFLSSKESLSSNDAPTINLLQLSSQLQRVEHQRQSMQVKQENDTFCCLRIT